MATELSGWLSPPDSDVGSGSWDLDRDLESLLFEELNDSTDVLEALKNPFDVDVEIDFSLESSPWDDDPWGPMCNVSPGSQIMSEPQSPASSCSMTSSADSILQHEELLYTLSSQSSPVSPCSKTSECSSPFGESKVTSSPEVKREESVPGQAIVVPQPAVAQLQPQSLPAAHPVINIAGGANHVGTVPLRVLTPANKSTMNGNAPAGKAAPSNRKPDVNALRRQERMIKNRESACLSRRKKKEYLLNLECRLRSALLENAKLKNENGSLQKQLKELMSENQQLKVTTPKRRAVCAMILLVFIALSYSPASVWEKHSAALQPSGSPATHSRHLLGFSDENGGFQETEKFTEENYRNGISFSDKKDLMVVKKEPLLFVKRACHPQVNRTESLRLADELRGWVHRHEVVRDKLRKGSKMLHRIRTVMKSTDKKTDVAQYVKGMYTDIDKNNSGSELQVYYAPDERYPDFFEAIRRRGDTFYLISFRRDHLLLPAISHNKTTRPKMSLVLPAMKMSENFINDPKDHEVMMQIDCEVMATRIIHIKSSSIPSFLREQRENHTDSYQRPSPAPTHAAPHIITESTHGNVFKLYQ
ncbi:cyclic AMP-dependent transcription factor ATF-6 alpha isoform X2 [Stegostoma tigrinum]|uniref:cyclic AMP-dependent transcription factor ATF-6 alpha isoform X2 n=1 Tax=Stegostoma tigrinum TaxID=3053191 RepID=UPI00286FF322|nr:cyclic AMP-dependent transcription factor ATF-6 alpha isoform X2 [Stegostoma tigrinum]